MLRAAAEAVREEIYRYRIHTQPMRVLQARLGAIDARLVRTEASTAPLTPYRGPLPPEILTPCQGLLPPEINGIDRYDDGLSLLNDRYLQIRVGDQIAYYHQQIRRLYHLRTALELLAIFVGGAGAILAVGFEMWIGLTGGMSTAALAYAGYLQVDNSIIAYNRAASSLARLQRDWMALSPREQDLAALDELVTKTEQVLIHERAVGCIT